MILFGEKNKGFYGLNCIKVVLFEEMYLWYINLMVVDNS